LLTAGRKSVWNCPNIMGGVGTFKSESILSILALSRKCGYLVEIFYEKKRRSFIDYMKIE